jgi:hypothetical protein
VQTGLLCCALALSLLTAVPAWGDDVPPPLSPRSGRTSSLSWIRLDGAESCVATQRLAQAVEERLARPVFVSASQADVSVEGHIERGTGKSAGTWQAWVSVRDAKGTLLGTRHLESTDPSCDALSPELAFVVAVMIDPDAATRSPAPAPPAPPENPAPPPPASDVVPAGPPRVVVIHDVVPAPEVKEPWHFEVGAGPALVYGLLPGAGVGVTLAAAVEPPGFWAVRMSGTTYLDDSVVVTQAARAVFSLTYGELALCPIRRVFGRVRALACAGAQVGALRTTGTGFPVSRGASESYEVNLAAEAEISVVLLKPLVAMAGLTLIVPTVREVLTYTQANSTTPEVFRTSAVAGVGQVGLGVSFL